MKSGSSKAEQGPYKAKGRGSSPRRTTSNRKRGLDYQRWCKGWIEDNWEGAVVHNQPMNHVCIGPGKWVSKENDILGCIDLVVIAPKDKPTFIQCSLHQKIGDRLADFEKIPWNLGHCDVQLWVKRPDGSTTIKKLVVEEENLCLKSIARIVRGDLKGV